MFEKEAKEYASMYARQYLHNDGSGLTNSYCEIYNAYYQSALSREKRIAELEEKISILLSCKNCPENKGGLLCQKEYEGKCLSQKTQYIKELKAENEELKKGLGCETCQIHLEYMSLNNRITDLEKENTELKAGRDINVFTKQLTKAKEHIRTLISCLIDWVQEGDKDYYHIANAEQFLKECEKE